MPEDVDTEIRLDRLEEEMRALEREVEELREELRALAKMVSEATTPLPGGGPA